MTNDLRKKFQTSPRNFRISIMKGNKHMKTITNITYLAFACFALSPSARAVSPPPDGAYPGLNTAEGQSALFSLADRVAYQWAIEEVYWRHRIWPKENAGSKPPLDKMMSQAHIQRKVEDYLRNSQVLEDYWHRPITSDQLQAEMDRMAQHTRRPEMLRDLFEALGDDPFVISECLARPLLSKRIVTNLYAQEQGRFNAPLSTTNSTASHSGAEVNSYKLPVIVGGGCVDDTWTATGTTDAPDGRTVHTAVWTGTEMIVWGGYDGNSAVNTGGRYDPGTDSWIPTSTTNAPDARYAHTAVWTGTDMIVWGGTGNISTFLNTGGRYDPSMDSWTPTSATNAPDARYFHTAVWTGSQMIVWGGIGSVMDINTGGRYNPDTDSWTVTSLVDAPEARDGHTAVWTVGEMIVWGGNDLLGNIFNTGGRYNPSNDSWTATSVTNAPEARTVHTTVWTGSEMIVWGGADDDGDFDTGGRYDPATDSWTATSTTNAPDARGQHTAIWTDNQMIVWGGGDNITFFNSGGRYDPVRDSWTATSTTNAPEARLYHTAVWTDSDSEMIVWGGRDENFVRFNTGGRYCAQSGPTPTPTPCTGRCSPTPRPRPTAHPRPR
jgi:N-acetylneuraminic acid mutarotase